MTRYSNRVSTYLFQNAFFYSLLYLKEKKKKKEEKGLHLLYVLVGWQRNVHSQGSFVISVQVLI